MKKIDSIQNQRVKQWKKLQMKKERDKAGKFLVEGFHLVEEALKRKECIQEIIISEEVTFPAGWNVDNVEIYVVPSYIMEAISATETPQGIAAVCEKSNYQNVPLQGGTFLLLDGVQDPGNLGTIIRTADAAGIGAVIIGEGCADVYNSKVLRSTQGAVFHLPIIKGSLLEWIQKLKHEGIAIFGTSLQDAVPYQEVQPIESFALLVGNEGSGVRRELLEQCDKNLYIPIYGQAESLNVSVAAGILTYYLRTHVAN
ncbi:RNA methyltransferase [Bacillus sp. 165]|uniref:TrmH family RNA methyltransferase n=1 Tax=Bacillus sp. 165 TaxID=1529117 RepID=UPI001AD9F57E|nr:RNA methyltransferase [Bacillus sp. 165]MBO9130587.1 RNA methyltransferase [Bacillus sp. 165]